MAVASLRTIESVTGFSTDVGLKVVEHLPEAELECKRILSTRRTRGEVTGTEVTGGATYRTVMDVESERYDEIEALGSDDKHYEALQRAEALMAVYYALPTMNLRMTEAGGISLAIDVEGTRSLMSQREMEAYRRSYYSQASEVLEKLYRYHEADEKVIYVS